MKLGFLILAFAASTSACRPSNDFAIHAAPDDVVVLALADASGKLISAHVEQAMDDPFAIERGDRIFAFVMHAKDFTKSNGDPLDAGTLEHVSARLDSEP